MVTSATISLAAVVHRYGHLLWVLLRLCIRLLLVGLLSVGLLSVGLLSVGLLSVGLLGVWLLGVRLLVVRLLGIRLLGIRLLGVVGLLGLLSVNERLSFGSWLDHLYFILFN